MPKVSPSHLESRRRGILAAAHRCVSRKGVGRTTIRDICRAANLSPGAVYRYFDGKDEILTALAENRQQPVDRFFEHLAGGDGSRTELLTRLADLVRRLDSDEALEGLRLDLRLWSEAVDRAEVRRPVVAGVDRMVRRIEPELPLAFTDEPAAMVRLVLALLQGLALQKSLDPGTDLEAAARAVENLVGGEPAAGS